MRPMVQQQNIEEKGEKSEKKKKSNRHNGPMTKQRRAN